MLMPSVSVSWDSIISVVWLLKYYWSFGIDSNSLIGFVQALYVSMDQYLQGLFILANDAAAEVRKLVSS